MRPLFDFPLRAKGSTSRYFLEQGIRHFSAATEFIRELPYRRNTDKNNLNGIFADRCGTCSTKHAVLRQLAIENDAPEVKLMLGMFRMNAVNTPAISELLSEYDLDYIPEAHNYLRINDEVLDCTWPGKTEEQFTRDLLAEQVITPEQITSFKTNYHKAFLSDWLKQQSGVPFTPDELWRIREACIGRLSNV